jgi:hypothetical protein
MGVPSRRLGDPGVGRSRAARRQGSAGVSRRGRCRSRRRPVVGSGAGAGSDEHGNQPPHDHASREFEFSTCLSCCPMTRGGDDSRRSSTSAGCGCTGRRGTDRRAESACGPLSLAQRHIRLARDLPRLDTADRHACRICRCVRRWNCSPTRRAPPGARGSTASRTSWSRPIRPSPRPHAEPSAARRSGATLPSGEALDEQARAEARVVKSAPWTNSFFSEAKDPPSAHCWGQALARRTEAVARDLPAPLARHARRALPLSVDRWGEARRGTLPR